MIQLKRTIARAVAGVATVAALAVTMVGIPAQAAEVKSSATETANVIQALKYIQELNTLRAKQNPSFTTQQIADAWTADYQTTYTSDQFDPVMSNGEPRPALKVSDDLMKWAQARADELAKRNELDNHVGMWNGAPQWAKSSKYGSSFPSLMDNPHYDMGKYTVGPENLAYQGGYANYSPIKSWNSEATYSGPDYQKWRQGYGHYLNNLNHLANLAGFGVAQSSSGNWFYTLELAYSNSQPSKTVDQALAEYIKPQSADSVSASTVEGMKPALPNTVNAHYSDGSQQQMPVTWNDTTDWSATKAGQTITINGTVTGTTVTTTATVTITAATAQSVDNLADVTTESGTKPTLPTTSRVHYSNGTAKDENVSWDAIDQASYSKREGGEFTVSGTVAGLPVQVKVIVNPATVTSVEQPKDQTITVGQQFTAPSTVPVKYSNGDSVDEAATWNDLANVKTDIVGDYTIHGTAAGQAVQLTVNVVAAKITDVKAPEGKTVASGTKDTELNLPTELSATFDNGTTSNVAVKWADLTAEQKATLAARDGGTIKLPGTVDGWDKPITITITVTKATVVNADIADADKNVTTESGTKPTLAKQGQVVWSNGDTEMAEVQWNAIDAAQYSARDGGQFKVTGKLAGKTVKTTVTVLPAKVSNIAPIAPVTTEAKVAPKLPSTVKVTWSNGDTTDETVTWNITAEDYAKRGSKEISGTVLSGSNQQTVKTTLTVTAYITKVTDPDTVTTPSGTDPKNQLPNQVTVTYSDDETAQADVTWDASTKAQYTQTKGGSYKLSGRVAGTDLPATITVHVTPATLETVDNPTAITVASGTKEADLQLPNTVVAHYSDGTTAPVSVKWDALTDKQKSILAAKDEGSFTLSGTAESKGVTLTIKVIAATITGVVSPDDIIVNSGTTADQLQLPATVTVHWSNGSESTAAVTWNALTDEQKVILTSIKGGSFTLGGDVAGYTKPQPRLLMRLFAAVTGAATSTDDVTITVHVTPATVRSIAPLPDVSTDSGIAPKLPETASVTWSNGQTTNESITWNKLDTALYSTRNASTFDVDGTTAGSPVKVTVKVNAATIVSVTAQTDTVETVVGTAPATLPSATVTWSNGDTESVMPSWDAISDNAVAQAGGFTEQGMVTVDSQTFNVSVKVVVKAKEEPKPEPEQKPDSKPTDNQQAGKNNSTNQQSTPAQSASQSKSSTTLAATGAAIAAIVVLAVLALAVGIALRVRSAKSTAATQSQHTEE